MGLRMGNEIRTSVTISNVMLEAAMPGALEN